MKVREISKIDVFHSSIPLGNANGKSKEITGFFFFISHSGIKSRVGKEMITIWIIVGIIFVIAGQEIKFEAL